jgi:hypothetical protein
MDVAVQQALKRDVQSLRVAIKEGFRLRVLKDGSWAGLVRESDGFGFPVGVEAARELIGRGLRGDWLQKVIEPALGLDLERADWYESPAPASGARRNVFLRFWDWLMAAPEV